ncbi:hypothetical protein M9H77_31725 [Catharanthus roseus]|uniref:Uncharacterized protein n=1 Tax=Catharanthus roseus TaxID=4058 RepID=A0ACC0A0Y8_CATRO|nr:hypothetical protein M9H77_31725 [Catharanthus roseus]
MVEEFSKVKELRQAQEVVEERIVIHVVKETSKVESCCIMSGKSIENKEKERVEEKEKLVERLCIFGSICIFSKEKSELEKSERAKENECYIEKQEIDEHYLNIANYVSYVQGIEDKGRNIEKDLGNFPKDLPISSSLNPSLMCYEVSLMELGLFLKSYFSHVSIYGYLCTISFGSGLFPVVSYVSTCLSSHAFLEDSLLHSDSMFHPSYHEFGVMNNASNESIVICFGLDSAVFDILRDKHLGSLLRILAMFPLSLILLWRIIMILFLQANLCPL